MKEPLRRCANCNKRFTDSQLKEVRDFWSRVEPGDTMPHGECPKCGCLCFADKSVSQTHVIVVTCGNLVDRVMVRPSRESALHTAKHIVQGETFSPDDTLQVFRIGKDGWSNKSIVSNALCYKWTNEKETANDEIR